MSASDEWTEWHLTPRGWERGTEHLDHGETKRDPPDDRMATVRIGDRYASAFSKCDHFTEHIWRSSDEKELGRLLSKYGNLPEVVSNPVEIG